MKKYLTTIFTLISFIKIINAQVIERDSLALVDFYNSMDGPNWHFNTFPSTWDLTSPISEWKGVSVHNGRVSGIRFWGWQGINGYLPESFGNLDSLSGFDIFDNGVGSLPVSFANLKLMTGLTLKASYGGPTQTFPNIILGLTKLQSLDFSQDALSGNIPEEIGNLNNLTRLDLHSNGFTGSIPQGTGNLHSLTFLDLSDTKLSGIIPGTFKNLNNIQYLNLDMTNSTAGLSGGLENIPTQNLKTLYIPTNFFNFTGIEELVKKNSISDFWYSPQKPINLLSINGRLAAPAGGTVANNTYKWYKDGDGLVATIVGDSTFQPAFPGNYHAEITNSIATQLNLTSNSMSAPSVVLNTCPLQPAFNINSNLSGSAYQWQQSTDSVIYTNITNNANFDGTNTSMLALKNIPSSWYGRRYRCVTNNGNSAISTLTLSNSWTGLLNTDWNNNVNWSCGNIPDTNTDVIIPSGTVVISTDVMIKSLTIKLGASVVVNPGIHVTAINK